MATGVLAAALVRVGERDRAQALIEQMGASPIPLCGPSRLPPPLLRDRRSRRLVPTGDPGTRSVCRCFCLIPYGKGLRESSRWPKLARMMNLPERIASI